MYATSADPYCYRGTAVLKNLPGLRDQSALDAFESVMTAQRADELLPTGRFGVAHYRAVHRHLFQDVYPWAGKFRTVRLGKGASAFCYPEHIAREMRALFRALARDGFLENLSRADFATQAASFLATLNAIHPFREGNGRAQVTFLALLAERAGHPFGRHQLQAKGFLAAMVKSFSGDDRMLVRQIAHLIG
jgi:cell filamentation protein, protein adenylyltransferase